MTTAQSFESNRVADRGDVGMEFPWLTEQMPFEPSADSPDPQRRRLLARLRDEIEAGDYDWAGKAELAIDRLIACHFPATLAPQPHFAAHSGNHPGAR